MFKIATWAARAAAVSTLAAGMLAASAAQSALVSGTITGGSAFGTGTVIMLDPSSGSLSVGGDTFGTKNLYILAEKQDVLLDQDLEMDLGGTIAKGTRVSSFLIIFDPVLEETVAATLTFERDLLGVDRLGPSVIATNALFGLPSVTYMTPAYFALEPGVDFVTLHSPDANSLRLSPLQASTPGDVLRVFTLAAPIVTAPVPEPASWALMLAGFGLAGLAMRKGRWAAAELSAYRL